MKVIVTGANGFIGRHLVSSLKRTHSVSALIRNKIYDHDKEVNWLSTDYSSDSLLRLLRGNDALIHLAAERSYGGITSICIENVSRDYRVFEAAKKAGVTHIIFASTRGVYGNQPAPWTEATPPAPCSVYALSKLQSEATADYFSREEISITTLRFAQVFGSGEFGSSVISTFLRNAFLGHPLVVSVKGIKREYIYVDDISSAIAKVLDSPVNGIFNLGSGEALHIEEIASNILYAFGRHEMPEFTKEIRETYEFSLMNSEKFMRHFNWQPTYTFAQAAIKTAKEIRIKGMT